MGKTQFAHSKTIKFSTQEGSRKKCRRKRRTQGERRGGKGAPGVKDEMKTPDSEFGTIEADPTCKRGTKNV